MSESSMSPEAVWSAGDYPRIAERFEPVAEALLDAVGELEGLRLLDVATGTGNVALAAAYRGANVLATDLNPRMLELARTRPGQDTVEWREADATALPTGDASIDVLTSCFGLMFVPYPTAAIHEAARVLRPGGRLAMTNWVPGRDSERLFEPLRRDAPNPPPGPDRGDWGRPDVLAAWLTPEFVELSCTPQPFSWDFATADEAADYFLNASPLHVSALNALPDDHQAAARAEVHTAAATFAEGTTITIPAPYLLVTAVRANG